MLFSAYAEVFLTDNQASGLLKTFLCLRRGVSKRKKWKKPPRNFSLPTQRCFSRIRFPHQSSDLFSAYAEVFLCLLRLMRSFPSFLCLRRGVSESERIIFAAAWLFSAYAEVFPFYSQSKRAPPPFLCLRRGVSAKSSETASAASFSLPTQRCFSGSNSAPVDAATFLCLRRGVS